jgi:hypothetical protein
VVTVLLALVVTATPSVLDADSSANDTAGISNTAKKAQIAIESSRIVILFYFIDNLCK